MTDRRTTQATRTTQTARDAYDGSVVARAMKRAGGNPHLKGHIHEVLHTDRSNLRNAFNGGATRMTASPTAKAVDVVTMRGGKIVAREQLKDATSPASLNKLVKQVRQGKYRGAKLMGTEETAAKVNARFAKEGIKRRMGSTGISTEETTRLAQQAGARGSGSLRTAAWSGAKSAGAAGAVTGAVFEGFGALVDYSDGQIDGAQAAGRVAKGAAKGGATGAASGAAATVAGAGAASLATTLGLGATGTAVMTVGAPIVAALAVGYVATSVWDWCFD